MNFLKIKTSRQVKKHIRNSISPVLGQLAGVLIAFVVTPLAVAKLGLSAYGIYVILVVLVGCGGLLTVGVGDATLRLVAKYRSSGEHDRLRGIVQSSILLFIAAGLIGSWILYSLSEPLLVNLFNVSPEHFVDAYQASRAASLALIFSIPSQALTSVIRGYQRFDLAALVQGATALITGLLNLVLLWAGYGVVAMAIVLGVGGVFSLLLNCLIALRLLPGATFLIPKYNNEALRESFGLGIYVWLGSFLNKMRSEGLPLIIGAILGPAATGIFSAASKPVVTFMKLVQEGTMFLMPHLTQKYEAGKLHELESHYRHASQIAVVLAACSCSVFVLVAEPFFQIWMGESSTNAMIVVSQILAVRFALLPMASVISQFMKAANRGRMIVMVQAISCAALLLATAVGAQLAGLVGAAWAQLIVVFTIVFNRYLIEKSVFGKGELLRQVYLVVGSITPPLLMYFAPITGQESLAMLSLYAILTIILSGLLSGFVVAGRDMVYYLRNMRIT